MTLLITSQRLLGPAISGASLVFLALLGALGANAGGAGILEPTFREALWGALAMAATALGGALVGKVIERLDARAIGSDSRIPRREQ